jgi:hypothetical protein
VTYNEDGKRKLPNEQFSGLEEYDPRTSIAETYVNSVVRCDCHACSPKKSKLSRPVNKEALVKLRAICQAYEATSDPGPPSWDVDCSSALRISITESHTWVARMGVFVNKCKTSFHTEDYSQIDKTSGIIGAIHREAQCDLIVY